MRAVTEKDLSASARRVVKGAAHWSVVGVVSTDEEGCEVLSLRGKRGGCRFVAVFVDGGFDAAYWWTRRQRAVVKGYREVERTTKVNAYTLNIAKKLEHDEELDEVVTWTTQRPAFVKLPSLQALVGVASRDVKGLLEIGTLDSVVT